MAHPVRQSRLGRGSRGPETLQEEAAWDLPTHLFLNGAPEHCCPRFLRVPVGSGVRPRGKREERGDLAAQPEIGAGKHDLLVAGG